VKKIEREAIDAIDRVLSIPFPASGAQSTTVRGLANYARDMRQCVPLAQRIVWALRHGSDYRGELRERINDANLAVDECLERIRSES
jgi:predicted TIM-barrel fold metal-dependent hydrolase